MSRFKVGQKVVCIKTHSLGACIKNEIYTVKNIDRNPCCNYYANTIDVGIKKGLSHYIKCGYCGKIYINDHKIWISEELFAPIEEYTDSLSIAESLVKELGETDKAKNPIKELEKI